MANTNNWTISGNLTRDPKLRQTGGGTDVCSLGVAVNGFRDDDTQFVDVSVWGKQANACAQHLAKGQFVVVTGRGKLRTWEGQDGQMRSAIQIDSRDVEFGPKAAGNGNGNGGAPAQQQAQAQPPATPPAQPPAQQQTAPAGGGGEDEIPF